MNPLRAWRTLSIPLMSLFLAVIIWTIVAAPRRERIVEVNFNVPLALVALPRDLVVTTDIQETVNARFRGRLSALRAVSAQNLAATLDLSELRSGDWRLVIRPQSINVPEGVEVVAIEPTRVKLRLELRRQRIVPIRPFLVGELPAGHRLEGTPDVVPKDALLSGPASMIRDVTEVATDRIILTGRVAPFRSTVGVTSDSSRISVIEPANVQVFVTVVSEREAGENGSVSPGTGAPSKGEKSSRRTSP